MVVARFPPRGCLVLSVFVLSLGACGSRRDPAAILADFAGADTRTCQYLAIELQALGAAGVPAWIELLHNKDKKFALHTMAAAELGSLGEAARDAIPALIGFLRDGYPGMQPGKMTTFEQVITPDAGRAPARKALGQIGALAVPAVRNLLQHPRSRTRQEAALALGQIGAPAAPSVPDLVRLVAAEDRAVATAAVWALGQIRVADEAAIRAVRARLGDKESILRFESLKTLGRFGAAAASALDDVRRAAGDPDSDVRRMAEEALQELAPSADNGGSKKAVAPGKK